jgi:hypothetical protein
MIQIGAALRPTRRKSFRLPFGNKALQRVAHDKFVVITGSLYLIGEALELLGRVPTAKSERELNEWSGGGR